MPFFVRALFLFVYTDREPGTGYQLVRLRPVGILDLVKIISIVGFQGPVIGNCASPIYIFFFQMVLIL